MTISVEVTAHPNKNDVQTLSLVVPYSNGFADLQVHLKTPRFLDKDPTEIVRIELHAALLALSKAADAAVLAEAPIYKRRQATIGT